MDAPCKIHWCDALATHEGQARSHRGGSWCPDGGSVKKPVPLEKRFWRKVNKADSCWLWTASVGADGYGQIGSPFGLKGCLRAHRVSWELHNGPIPDGLFVCHYFAAIVIEK